MKRLPSFLPRAAMFAFFTFFPSFFSADAGAAELVVPTGFPTIQAATNAAAPGDAVVIEPGTYQETITLNKDITLRGRETARTILSGGGGGPVVRVNGPIAAAIRNFTFITASTGILVTGNTSTLSITNNVFTVGTEAGKIAIDIQGSIPGFFQTEVINNVFYQNAVAISRDSDIPIVNNIFSNNTRAINSTATTTANISFNAFFGATIPNDTLATPRGNPAFVQDVGAFVDPFFVDPAVRDFHLDVGSALKNIGALSVGPDFDNTRADLGAYGGPLADPIPFPVQGLKIASFTENSIDLEWQPNNSYLIDNGGYKLYYGHSSGLYNGTEADGGLSPSPINVGGDTFFSLGDLPPAVDTLDAPVLFPPERRSEALALSWSSVGVATGYKMHYGQVSTDENTIDVGNTTSYTLAGLANGQSYSMAVSSYVPSSLYFLSITAFDGTPAANESAFSQEVSVQLGQATESGLSNIVTDFPDLVQAYPALPNGRHSCFIATAAYGSYSAPEVLALRAFRDRYLLSSAPGRRFVEWYYRRGPAAAALLNGHPAWKPAVRAALMPFVGMAIVMTGTSTLVKAFAALALMSAIGFGFRRKRLSGTGEIR